MCKQRASGAPVSSALPPNRTTVEPRGAVNISWGCDDDGGDCDDEDGWREEANECGCNDEDDMS